MNTRQKESLGLCPRIPAPMAPPLSHVDTSYYFQTLGYAEGYDISFVRDVRRNPELANDLENVRFVEKRGRKKRRPGADNS